MFSSLENPVENAGKLFSKNLKSGGNRKRSIKLATFLRFLAANLGKKLNTQTFRTKKFSFYVAKHKNRHHRGQFNRWYFLAISHSKAVVNKRIKK